MIVFLHAAAYQLTWFSTVFGWLHGHIFWGSLASLLYIIGLQLTGQLTPLNRIIFMVFALLGFGIETIHQHVLIAYEPGWFAPIWITPLWGVFGLFIRLCLRWLQRRQWAAVLIGSVSGTLTYAGVAKLAGVSLNTFQIGYLALEWAILLPFFLSFIRYMEIQYEHPNKH